MRYKAGCLKGARVDLCRGNFPGGELLNHIWKTNGSFQNNSADDFHVYGLAFSFRGCAHLRVDCRFKSNLDQSRRLVETTEFDDQPNCQTTIK